MSDKQQMTILTGSEVVKLLEMAIQNRQPHDAIPIVSQWINAAEREVSNLRQQLAEAQAIIDKLPKTTDGVPVWPGMVVWYLFRGIPYSTLALAFTKNGRVMSYAGGWTEGVYSTREAAEAAGETQ
jgi:hypothetical protein